MFGSKQKWVTEQKNQASAMAIPVPDLNPMENEWAELKRRSWDSEGSGEILYGGMVSDLLSGVLQTHQAL